MESPGEFFDDLRILRFRRHVVKLDNRRTQHQIRDQDRPDPVRADHPIGAGLNPKRDVAIRRLIRQVGADDIALLDTLRSVEIDVAGGPEAAAEHAKLDALAAAVERVQRAGALALRRFDLALDGREVMQILDCGPGRKVGLALQHLTEAVIEEPSRNTPSGLRRLLAAWVERDDVEAVAEQRPKRSREPDPS